MLQALADLGEEMLLRYLLSNVVAYDPETGAELHHSEARRKYGRPTRYYVCAPDGGRSIHYFRTEATPENPKGARITPWKGRVFGLTAYTHKEAIEKANAVFPKKYAKFLQERYREETREEGKDFGRAWWQDEGVRL
jgi:hypothetical protein